MKTTLFQTVSNQYRTIKNIGNGGAGHVFEVEDLDGEHYALKVLDAYNASRKKTVRFVRERKYCERSGNAAIVPVLDDGYNLVDGQSIPFYIMPLYECSLRNLMDGRSALTRDELAHYFIELFGGIATFHSEENYHRDIKPENILFDSKRKTLVLADFGTAHLNEAIPGMTVQTTKSDRLANFRYAAPEQRVPGGETDNRTDIFALGLVLNEIFTGEVPQGSSYKQISAVEPDFRFLDAVVEKMIRQDKAARYQSLDEVISDIEARNNLQQLNESVDKLRKQKIEQNIAEDPLVADPIEVIGKSWKDGNLYFQLSRKPNDQWVRAFKSNPEDYWSTTGFEGGPKHFDVQDSTVIVKKIRDDESRMKEVIDKMPGYVQFGNESYACSVEKAAKEEEQHKIESRKSELKKTELEERMNRLLLDS